MSLHLEAVESSAGQINVELRQCDNTTCNRLVKPLDAEGWIYTGVTFEERLPDERRRLHGKDACSADCLVVIALNEVERQTAVAAKATDATEVVEAIEEVQS